MRKNFKATETFQYTNKTSENITTYKKTPYGERLSSKPYKQHILRNEILRMNTGAPPTKQNKESNLALRHTISVSSYKISKKS